MGEQSAILGDLSIQGRKAARVCVAILDVLGRTKEHEELIDFLKLETRVVG